VRRWRALTAGFLVLGALALGTPAGALASCPGTSAGDQQYVDPLCQQTTPTTSVSQPTPAPTAQVVAQAPASTSSPPTGASTLPRTGFDLTAAVVVGLGMIAVGVALRISTRRGARDQ
jgi:hypothetical protein